jgi:hypothetical protein
VSNKSEISSKLVSDFGDGTSIVIHFMCLVKGCMKLFNVRALRNISYRNTNIRYDIFNLLAPEFCI